MLYEVITLAQARQKALSLGGELAKPEEVEIAWQKDGLNVLAYARMSDGRFALPIQTDNASFRRGTNIGIQGGNQGFLYVRQRA